MKNELNTRFEQNFTMGSYGIGIGRAWCSKRKNSLVQKKKLKKIFTQAAQTAFDQFLVSRNFRG
jgi:hypothetical protein